VLVIVTEKDGSVFGSTRIAATDEPDFFPAFGTGEAVLDH